MTIILAVPTINGVILASDGQMTSGLIRARGQKIKVLNEHCIWGAAGRESLIQRIEEKIENFPERKQPLKLIKDKLAQIIRDSTLELFILDRQPAEEEFIFVECIDSPLILHVTTNGTPEYIRTGPFGVGIAKPFVHALLQRYSNLIPQKIDTKKGALLVHKVIEEAIEVGAYGLGMPIDVWEITKTGAKQYDNKEKEKLSKSCQKLRNSEITVFLERIY